MSSTLVDSPELSTWGELPVWAALLIVTTAKGLTRPAIWAGWHWSTRDDDQIIVHSLSGYRYMVRKGAPWVV